MKKQIILKTKSGEKFGIHMCDIVVRFIDSFNSIRKLSLEEAIKFDSQFLSFSVYCEKTTHYEITTKYPHIYNIPQEQFKYYLNGINVESIQLTL